MFLDPWFWFWAFLLVAGFAYVAWCICKRDNPFHSRRGHYDEFAKLLISVPFLFFLGPRHNIEPLMVNARSILIRAGVGYALPFFLALHWYYLQDVPHINYSLALRAFSADWISPWITAPNSPRCLSSPIQLWRPESTAFSVTQGTSLRQNVCCTSGRARVL
jgi:hypothetical protein